MRTGWRLAVPRWSVRHRPRLPRACARGATGTEVEVDYVEGDLRELPFADGRFDAVINWRTSFGVVEVLGQDGEPLRFDSRRLMTVATR